uniref:Extracellular metalloproteinase n=1 Tax=Ganoderma boninense TaxID=34458 RepID=A0A5K1JRT9_9APHY|nr:Extracellular metalloproteinase 1 (EC (Fungalysin MEP1) [Ganoderma boninense]
MQFSASFVRSVYVAVVLAAAAFALPFSGSLKHTTTQVRTVSADKTVESFHPESSFETFGVDGIDHPLSARAEFSLEDAAVSFVQSKLNLTSDSAAYRTGYSNDVVQHAYINQHTNGVPVANAVANIAFNKANKVVSFGSSFIKPSNVPSTTPSISAADAISKAESELGGKYNQHPTKLELVAKQDGSVALTHVVQVRDDSQAMWYEAFVDAHSGDIVQLTDFVAQASYRVVPITKQDLTQGFQMLVSPQNTASSPFTATVPTTAPIPRNNVITYVGAQQFTTQQSSATLNFVYMQDPTVNPDALQANIDAARVNTFYVVNAVHDISYQSCYNALNLNPTGGLGPSGYGFTEAAFNFQNNNFGKGGAGSHRVTVSVQDASGKNNAFFSTPPECLQTLEATGLGEGWSDALAEWTEWTNATVSDWVIGAYAVDNRAGFRTHPYSTSTKTNPLRYSSLLLLAESHDIGEVWANMLHNVYAQLVAAHGFSATAKTDAT